MLNSVYVNSFLPSNEVKPDTVFDLIQYMQTINCTQFLIYHFNCFVFEYICAVGTEMYEPFTNVQDRRNVARSKSFSGDIYQYSSSFL